MHSEVLSWNCLPSVHLCYLHNLLGRKRSELYFSPRTKSCVSLSLHLTDCLCSERPTNHPGATSRYEPSSMGAGNKFQFSTGVMSTLSPEPSLQPQNSSCFTLLFCFPWKQPWQLNENTVANSIGDVCHPVKLAAGLRLSHNQCPKYTFQLTMLVNAIQFRPNKLYHLNIDSIPQRKYPQFKTYFKTKPDWGPRLESGACSGSLLK